MKYCVNFINVSILKTTHFFLFFVLIYPLVGSSASQCSKLFLNINTHYSNVVIKSHTGGPLSKKVEAKLKENINNLENLTQGKLKLPSYLTIIVEPPGDKAFYIDNSIHIPIEFKSVSYRKHPKQSAAVFAHEWGHSLLEHNLKILYPDLFTSRSKQEFNFVYMAYSELFSDIIAVLHLKDGRAARDPLFNSADGELRGDNYSSRLRDFTENHQLENWQYEGPYALLSPTRSWLWDSYLEVPRVYRESGHFLKAVIDTIGHQMMFRLNNIDLYQTPEKINQDFINDFKKRIAFLGI